MKLSNRIREIRKSYNLSQAELAYRCNISTSAYGKIERNAEKSSLETLRKVASGLGVSTVFLIDTENIFKIN